MAIFDERSRYVKHATQYETVDSRGRTVRAVGPAIPPATNSAGDHLRKEHQRLDHLAAHYLGDSNGYWRIVEHNPELLPDAVASKPIVRIPQE